MSEPKPKREKKEKPPVRYHIIYTDMVLLPDGSIDKK